VSASNVTFLELLEDEALLQECCACWSNLKAEYGLALYEFSALVKGMQGA